jgi:hypothetical protein
MKFIAICYCSKRFPKRDTKRSLENYGNIEHLSVLDNFIWKLGRLARKV